MTIKLLWFFDLDDANRESVCRRAIELGLIPDAQKAIVVQGDSSQLEVLCQELRGLHPWASVTESVLNQDEARKRWLAAKQS